MRVIYSDNMPAPSHYDESLWCYNGMDDCITMEVHNALKQQDGGFAYLMGRAMQGPALTMMRRGVRIDFTQRDRLLMQFEEERARYADYFSRITRDGLGGVVNPGSPAQLKNLFYDTLKIEPIKRYDKSKRERVVTTNREALEKLVNHPRSAVLAKILLELRDLDKRLQVLRTGIDPDGRLRCSYNTTGTETGRWSSSENAYGRGTNLQNITDEMRRLVIPDPGKKFVQLDLAQAESVIVAYLSGDVEYLAACNSGDPHTYVCELCWPELPWATAADKSARREIAERPYYRHFSYRDLAKRGGHGSNYGGTPHVLSMHLKIPVSVADGFQQRYFGKFPGILGWHRSTVQQIGATRMLETPLGRRRYFTGRPNDSTTIKEAIAYVPQSTIGDVLNLGLYRVWRELDLPGHIELLLQVHDSILFQYDPLLHNEAELIQKVQNLMRIPLVIKGNECIIRSDPQIGWNWGKVKKDKKTGEVVNPHGLSDWKGSDSRQAPPEPSQLDRRLCFLNSGK